MELLDKKTIINSLRNLKPKLDAFGISKIGLFGSYVRGEENPKSDIDILIHFEPAKKTFDSFMAVYDLLEESFKGKKVEVITKEGLSPFIGPEILKTVEYA